jgi:hypothetical protein
MGHATSDGQEPTLLFWRARRDSNPRPSDPKSDALSAELRAPARIVAQRGERPQEALSATRLARVSRRRTILP